MKTRIFFSGHIDVEAPEGLDKHVGNAIGKQILGLPELSGNTGLFGEYTGKPVSFQLGKRVPVKDATKTTRKARAGKVAPPPPVKSQETGGMEAEEVEETAAVVRIGFTNRDRLFHEQFKTFHRVLEVVGNKVALEEIEEWFSIEALLDGIKNGVWRDVTFYTDSDRAALAGEAQP